MISVRTTGAESTVEEVCARADRYIDIGINLLQVSMGFGRELANDMADIVDVAWAMLTDPNGPNFVLSGTECEPCRVCKSCLWSPMGKIKCPVVAARHKKNPDCSDFLRTARSRAEKSISS